MKETIDTYLLVPDGLETKIWLKTIRDAGYRPKNLKVQKMPNGFLYEITGPLDRYDYLQSCLRSLNEQAGLF